MTAPGSASTRSGLLRTLLLAAAGLCVLGVVGWLALQASDAPPAPPPAATLATAAPAVPAPAPHADATPAPPAAQPAATAAPAPALAPVAKPATTATAQPTPPAPAPEKPSFDIVRVSPQGDTVVAGRAAAGAEVTLKSNGQAIGSTTADASGQFVILPDKPLGPGGRELTLSARDAAGDQTTGSAPVIVAMPAQPGAPSASGPAAVAAPAAGTAAPALIGAHPGVAPAPLPGGMPLVMLAPTGAAPRILQGPGAPTKSASPGVVRLGLGVVDYDATGKIRFAGNAPPGATIRLYIDNHPVAEVTADADGHWTAEPSQPVAPGTHILRLDQIAPGSSVVEARIQLPFQRADLSAHAATPASPSAPAGQPATSPVPTQIIVQPTQNLWRIARGAYGEGIRYTDIYAANSNQIRDPNLIYPGQIFTLPPAARPAVAAPDSHGKSR